MPRLYEFSPVVAEDPAKDLGGLRIMFWVTPNIHPRPGAEHRLQCTFVAGKPTFESAVDNCVADGDRSDTVEASLRLHHSLP